MRALLDRASTRLGRRGVLRRPRPCRRAAARRGGARASCSDVEADVKADPLALNRGLFFDREGRHLRIDEVAR